MAEEHLNWARKHRPKNLNEYMGEKIKEKMLSRLSDSSKYPRVILLEGDRGSGKTSLARLIAVEMLCQEKVGGLACGKCYMCEELKEHLLFADNGSTTDNVLEINVAVDGGKSAIENVIEQMEMEPLDGDYKICILDECHRLTQSAQNALLKRLEEPKNYEVYILCTTEADKLLQPIKSRCEVTLKVKPASMEDLTKRLIDICKIEGVEIGTEAVKAIANACNRNPRESILKLEDLAKSHNFKIDVNTVLSETATYKADMYIEYFVAINKGLGSIVEFNSKLKNDNVSGIEFLRGLTDFVLSCIDISLGVNLDRYQKEYISRVKQFFSIYTTEDIDCLLQIIEYARRTITSDESMADLLLLTTATRIGKIKLLAVGLYNEAAMAIKENQNGNKKHVDNLRESKENKSGGIREKVIDDSILSAVFGKQLVEVKAESASKLVFEDDDEDDEDLAGSLASDSSFLEDFQSKF